MKPIRQTYEMKASVQEVFDALTKPEIIERWSGAPAQMDDKEGTKFKLWNGQIHGTNLEVVPDKKLVQHWYGGKWDKPSKATFNLEENNEGMTTVELIHEDVPDNAYKEINSGWEGYYLGKIKEMFEG